MAQDAESDALPAKLVQTGGVTAKDRARIFPNGPPVSGAVLLTCTLTAEGAFTACTGVESDPPGNGLLAAALQEASLFRFRLKDRDGKPVAGRKETFWRVYLAPGDKNSTWLHKPKPENIAAAFPARAMKEGVDGVGVIACTITTDGFLDRCRVTAENPAGYGFGDAALILSKQFAMTPRIRGGKAVESERAIPISFKIPSAVSDPPRARVMVDPPWAKTPSPAQVAAAWPTRAKDVSTGQAALRCGLTKMGAPTACDVISQIPPDKGFGAAAKSLASSFVAEVRPEDASALRDIFVDIPFRFRAPSAPDNGQLTEPRWTQSLTATGAEKIFPQVAREAGLLTGVGYVDCAATAEGGLSDCRVTREDPAGKGFGAAALEAAKYMKMNPWTKGGDPVEGRRLTLPIRLKIEAAAPPAVSP